MARPLKYGEKTTVRSVTIPDSMWEALPEPRSQWVVEAIRQFLEAPFAQSRPQAEGAPMSKDEVKDINRQISELAGKDSPETQMTPEELKELTERVKELSSPETFTKEEADAEVQERT